MLTTPQILRLVAAELEDAHAKEAFIVGQHAVQAAVALKVRGSVEQLPEQLVTPTVRLPLLSILALVCERAGVKANRMAELIIEAADEAFETESPVSDWIEHSKAAERKARELITSRLKKVARAGQLRRILTLEDVQVDGATLSGSPLRTIRTNRRQKAG